jgi:hypothetical protein
MGRNPPTSFSHGLKRGIFNKGRETLFEKMVSLPLNTSLPKNFLTTNSIRHIPFLKEYVTNC